MSTHKEYALIAILATMAVVGVVPAFADCPPDCNTYLYNPKGPILPISITTDKLTYDHASTIIVSGHVDHPYPSQDIGLRVVSPQGNVVGAEQISSDSNGDYRVEINTASPWWQENGLYTIYVQQGDEQARTNQIQVGIIGEAPPLPKQPAIPEFGPIAALVLAIAIISIIAVSAKTGLRFMPKY
jgi:predicted secreted protein with PEFG-CTERM motif